VGVVVGYARGQRRGAVAVARIVRSGGRGLHSKSVVVGENGIDGDPTVHGGRAKTAPRLRSGIIRPDDDMLRLPSAPT
jgi:hypothetical protein